MALMLVLCTSCEPERAREPEPDDLDDLAVEDLGGGQSPRTWTIVFVGDGYAPDERSLYRARVAEYVTGLRQHADGFVAMRPDAFHFYRVDPVGPGWQLGTYLDRGESCGEPMIEADPELVARAARNAVAEPDVVVLVAHGLAGRANAGVHVSDRDGWGVVEHELAHALFGLADEYPEYLWCSAPASEAQLLGTPNETVLAHAAKWSGHAAGIESGGGRWPCRYHPTDSCIMGDDVGGAFCPVCAAAVRDVIEARMCGSDREPPRVALVDTAPATLVLYQSGQTLALETAAYDEGEVAGLRVLVDGTPLDAWGGPWHELDLDGLAPGQHAITAQAIDRAGNIGTSAPRKIDIVHVGSLAPSVTDLEAVALPDGWIEVTATATPLGGTFAVRAGAEVGSAPIGSASAFTLFVPGGSTQISGVATTARGVASPPRAVAVMAASLATAAPQITSVKVANLDVATLSLVGQSLDVDVFVRSCAPLASIEITAAESGKRLGATAVRARRVCDHVVRVPVVVASGMAVVSASDHFGRAGTATFVLPPITDLSTTCALEPRVDDPVVGLARPVLVGLGRPGSMIVASSVAVGGESVPTFAMTRPDGTRGALIAARAMTAPGAPRNGESVELRVTVVGDCGGGRGALTTGVPVRVDTTPPALRVHRFRRDGEPLYVESDAPIETLERAGVTVVRATDPAGNVTQREVVPIVFPHARRGCPQ